MSLLRRERASRPWVVALALVLSFFSSDARAAVPRIVGAPLVENPTFDGAVNTMMYTVTVTVDGVGADPGHVALVGYASDEDFTTCSATTAWKWAASQRFDTSTTRTWTLYNFLPGTTYRYKVVVGAGPMARTRCGILQTAAAPTPTLPTSLTNLNLTYAHGGATHPSDTRYVLLETDDCGGSGTSFAGARDYLVVVDPQAEAIVWYLDVGAASGMRGAAGTGFRYQPGPTATSGRILMSIARRYLFVWNFDGTAAGFHDFGAAGECSAMPGSDGPCPHHDAFQSDDTGYTYALASMISATTATGTEWEDACGDGADFIDDGYNALDESFEVADERYLMTDYGYDPLVDGGPNAVGLAARPSACAADTWNHNFDQTRGTIDWTHTNSIAASMFGPAEMIDLSLKEWSQVVRINATTGELVWQLSGRRRDSDWSPISLAPGIVGTATFVGQHDVHAIGPNRLMMFDNQGDPLGSRILQMFLDASSGGATIEKSWAVVDGAGSPLKCGMEGAAELVPDSPDGHAFSVCKDRYVATELDDPTGASGTAPAACDLAPGRRPDRGSVLRVGWPRRPQIHPRLAAGVPARDRRRVLIVRVAASGSGSRRRSRSRSAR